MSGDILNKDIELVRVRYEYFYNGILTFDIRHCNYDCLFCFSKECRDKVNKKIKKKNILHVIRLENLFCDETNKRIRLKGENSNSDLKIINDNFGVGYENNNLFVDNNVDGNYFILTNIPTFVNHLFTFFTIIFPNLTAIRFTGGEITHPAFLEWFNEFLKVYYIKRKGELNLIIETNGSRYSKEPLQEDFRTFLQILNNKDINPKVHVRISLKNPVNEFYEVLTKLGSKEQLDNAIDFGLFCLEKKIEFHYTFMANYLSIDDLIEFKIKIIKKLEDGRFGNYENNLKIFFKIFQNIEFERLFYYPILFKEFLIADKLLEKEKTINSSYDLISEDEDFKEMFNKMEKIVNNRSKFTNMHMAYYARFYYRSLPAFKSDIDLNIFFHGVKQYQRLVSLFKTTFKEIKKFSERVDHLVKGESNNFEGYEGIQQFWEHTFQSRYLLENVQEELIGKKLHFTDVSIVDRIPLYPGIFYLRDFWNQSNPHFFIYTLYSERKFIKSKNSYCIFSINSNPNSHAHTDISRAIPFIIDSKHNSDLIDKILRRRVININSIILEIVNITNYVLEYQGFKIIVPLFILKLDKIEDDLEKKEITGKPFLGSIGALYDNLYFKGDNLYYLNYFIWTGLANEVDLEVSKKKAYKYLFKIFENLSIRKGSKQKYEKWLNVKYLEPKNEVIEDAELTQNFPVLGTLDSNQILDLIDKIAQNVHKFRTMVE